MTGVKHLCSNNAVNISTMKSTTSSTTKPEVITDADRHFLASISQQLGNCAKRRPHGMTRIVAGAYQAAATAVESYVASIDNPPPDIGPMSPADASVLERWLREYIRASTDFGSHTQHLGRVRIAIAKTIEDYLAAHSPKPIGAAPHRVVDYPCPEIDPADYKGIPEVVQGKAAFLDATPAPAPKSKKLTTNKSAKPSKK